MVPGTERCEERSAVERHELAEVRVLAMPRERLGVRRPRRVNGRDQRPAMQRVVRASVLEVGLEAAADEEPALRVDGHVATIEQSVEVRPQSDAVPDGMLAAAREWLDVCRVENRQRVLLGDRARAAVRVEHTYTEDALTESRSA